nr:MAG TPA: hypothetical protein [Caudoviricetes sp.]
MRLLPVILAPSRMVSGVTDRVHGKQNLPWVNRGIKREG